MLRIMSMNLNGYRDNSGPWPVRQGLMREMITDTLPDVVALQAVVKDAGLYQGDDQAVQLSKLLPDYKTVIFRPGMCSDYGPSTGMGFLACIDIDETDHLPIRESPGEEEIYQCLVLHARFTFPHTQFHLFNVYLARHPLNAIRNIRDVIAFTKFYAGPALILGDLNLGPESEPLKMLRDEGWIDLWPEFYPDDKGLTYYEDHKPVSRFDYAWANPELRPYVEGLKILTGNQGEVAVSPSSHAGLLVWLNLQTQVGI